jgi:zinc transporter ZupT
MVVVPRPLLTRGLEFAVGAMLFVIAYEMIPESHKKNTKEKQLD